MMILDKHVSIFDFYRLVYGEIYRRIRTHQRSKGPIGKQELFDGAIASSNAQLMAQGIVSNLAKEKAKKSGKKEYVKAFSADGRIIEIDHRIIRSDAFSYHSDIYSAPTAGERRAKLDILYSLDVLGTDFWIDYISKNQIERRNPSAISSRQRMVPFDGLEPPFGISVVDWDVGVINLDRHRSIQKNLLIVKEGLAGLKGEGLSLPDGWFHWVDDPHINSFLAMSAPLEGMQLFVPQEWQTLIKRDDTAPLHVVNYASAKDAILSLSYERPHLNKMEIMQEVIAAFPKLTARRFNSFWNSAAEENEALRKPGRKRRD